LDIFLAAQQRNENIQAHSSEKNKMEELKWLEPPFAPFDIPPSVTVRITPIRYELGRMIIKPLYPGAPPEKEVVVLRIWVDLLEKIEQLIKIGELPPGILPIPPEVELAIPPYWDIAQRRLYPALLRILEAPPYIKYALDIHKIGTPPKAFFSIKPIRLA